MIRGRDHHLIGYGIQFKITTHFVEGASNVQLAYINNQEATIMTQFHS